MEKPRFILTDIEGTTTPKSFVYDVLFPYFSEHLSEVFQLKGFAAADHAFEQIQATIQEEQQRNASSSEVLDTLKDWVKSDRKHPGLKALQGLVWNQGYVDGTLKGIVYDDVPPALDLWEHDGIGLGVYSSGSVNAQKLLFGYSNYGDLCPFFSAYFDTAIGHKREIMSYESIASKLGLPPKDILFLSDIKEELDAAEQAGMKTIQLVRDETTDPAENHPRVTAFNEILWK